MTLPLDSGGPLSRLLPHGEHFDTRSIMIYPSYPHDVLQKKASMDSHESLSIWQGGHWDPAKASLSVYDILRIAQLYPKGPDEKAAKTAVQGVMKLQSEEKGWGQMVVRIPGLIPESGWELEDSLMHPFTEAKGQSGGEGADTPEPMDTSE